MDIVCFGELMIDMVADEAGPLDGIQSFSRFAGGAAANVAIQIRRLGGNPVFIGKLGRDGFGQYLAAYMEQNGVDVHAVVFDQERRTSVAYVTLDRGGVPSYLFYRRGGACVNLRPDELDLQAVRQAGIFYFSTLALTEEPLRTTLYRAIHVTKQAGALAALDLNYRASAWPNEAGARREIQDVLGDVDILKVNREELVFITDCADVPAACEGLFRGNAALQLLILTDGAAGSAAFIRGQESLHFSAGKGIVVDTTGAGDSYMGAFLYALARDGLCLDRETVRRAGDLAARAAAHTVSRRGAIPAMPDARMLEL
ncbi:carbohydrate kinase [Clostridiaceae bacterium]|nr:carbohydrate kinase [Clostridiaceae bacterium]